MASQKSALNAPVLLMGPNRVQRSIHRMAYQIAEDNRNEASILMLGIKERGYIVAQQLAASLGSLSKQSVQTLQLPVGDSGQNASIWGTLKEETPYTVLVDDVIFSGRTMLQAIRNVLRHKQTEVLRTAVLVDRGHRKVPIKASFKGLQWPTKFNEHVRVITHTTSIKKVIVEDA